MLVAVWLATAAAFGADDSAVPGTFRRLAISEGLIDNVVYGIVQDARGFMWFGTEGGLVRYDGRAFRTFEIATPADPLPAHKDISTLQRGARDVIWAGTWGAGLVRFEPASERSRRFHRIEGDPGSLSDDRVQTVYEDRGGRVWVGTFNGLNRLNLERGSFERFEHVPDRPESLSHSRIWSLSQAEDGSLWVGTDAGVDVLDAAGHVVAHHVLPTDGAEQLDHGRARVVFHDRAGDLWVGGQAGVYLFDRQGRRFTRFRAGNRGTVRGIITDVVEGRDGSLWFGTLGAGMKRLGPSRDTVTDYAPDPFHPGRLGHGDVRALWIDKTDLLWVATRGGGVSLVDLRRPVVDVFERGRGRGQAWSQEVASVYVDPDGSLWAGSLEGLRRWDRNGHETRYVHDPTRPDSLSADLVRGIVSDRRGRYWVATLNGLDRLDPRTGRFEHFRHVAGDAGSLSHNRVNAVLVDRVGRLWVGTQNGLNRLDPDAQKFTRFNAGEAGLSDGFVRVLIEDRAGTVWLGTEVGGVCRWRDATASFECLRSTQEATSLSDNRIFSLYESQTGTIWVGTDSGLDALDPKTSRVERETPATGLPTTDVYGVIGDRAGELWLTSGRALYRFNPATGRSRAFVEAGGLRVLAFSRGACASGADGALYFGGLTGVIRAWPGRAEAVVADASPLELTDVLVDETRVSSPLSAMTELSLSSRATSFRVSFAALDYRSPETRRYRYRLDGFETRWHSPGTAASAVYTNLDPGEYVLQVRTASSDGVWTEPGLSLPVRVRPPWWETGPFRAVLLALITTMAASIVVGRVAWLKRRQRELGRLVDERTSQLVDANRRLEQLARTDGLTGLANYRAFAETLDREWARARREGGALSVAMVDVDRFKTYNDTFGHRAGDDALRRIAAAIGGLIKRDGDLVARYGGDEFSMVLVGSERHGAVGVAEHARIAVESLNLFEPGSTLERLTLSVGVATTAPNVQTTTEDLLRGADQALYEAKRRGRNCVVARVLVPSPAGSDGALDV